MQQNRFLLVKKFKNTESAQLWKKRKFPPNFWYLHFGIFEKSAAFGIL